MTVALLPEKNGREALSQLRDIVFGGVPGVNSGCSVDLTAFPEEPPDFQSVTQASGVRLVEEEVEDSRGTTTFRVPSAREEAEQRLVELEDEAREIRLRLLNDDDEKQFLWRRLGLIRDCVAEIHSALNDDERQD